MRFAALCGRDDLWPAFDETLEAAKKNLIDVWHSSYDPSGAAWRTSKGSVRQVGYHVCAVCAEALRLASIR